MAQKTVDVDIECCDVVEYIEYASGGDLKRISEAFKKRAKEIEHDHISLLAPIGFTQFHCQTAAQEIAANRLQEALDQHGVEWVAEQIKK